MRFLTPKGKRGVLAAWEHTKQAWHIGEINGPGEPDANIIPWCDRINELPGICTLQSCAGHRDGKFKSDGHLWLWMDHIVHSRFHANAFLLLQNKDHVDLLSTLYLHDGKEAASITFYGNGHDRLDASITLIYGFLCGIANETAYVRQFSSRSLERHSLSRSPVVGRPETVTES